MGDVQWGMIGAGDVCEVKSGPAFQHITHSKLIAIMRRDPEKAEDFAKRHHIPKWYTDADQLIHDPEVSAIYVATPPDTHAYYVHKAAQAKKPVYVEKPMARTHSEALAMINACKNANVPLFVAYYRRALPNILKVKEIIDSGVLGEIRYVDIKLVIPKEKDNIAKKTSPKNWRVDPEVAGGGYVYDLASHQLDTMDFIFGPITEAKGFSVNQSRSYAADDMTAGVFTFRNGTIGHGLWAFNTSKISTLDNTTIVGSKGQVSFAFFGNNSVVLELEGKDVEVMNFNITQPIQQPLIQMVVDELMGKGTCPSTGISAARTNWVLEQLCNSQ